MKTKSTSLLLGVALLVLGSGCRVICEFSRQVGVNKAGSVFEKCQGEIVSCKKGEPGCWNVLKIACGGVLLYRGPYTVEIDNGFISYIAKNWAGPDPLFIRTEIPFSGPLTLSEVRSDGDRAAGYCLYENGAP